MRLRTPRQAGAAQRPAARTARGRELRAGASRAAVLLEVVLAIALFATSAGVVAGSLSAATSAVFRVKTQALASDLAVTKLSEVQMGLLPAADEGPHAYEEDERLADWTWQIVTSPVDEQNVLAGPPLRRVEVVVRNAAAGMTYRLVGFVRAAEAEAEDASVANASGAAAEAP